MRVAMEGETGFGDGGIEFRHHQSPAQVGKTVIVAYAGTESAADAPVTITAPDQQSNWWTRPA